MKLIRLLLYMLLVVSFFSCEKENITPQENRSSAFFPFYNQPSRQYDANIHITSQTLSPTKLIPSEVYINALFMNNHGRAVEIGGVNVEGIDLQLSKRTLQYSILANKSEGQITDTIANFISAFQDKEATFRIDGGQSGFPDVQADIPLPSLIAFKEPIDTIDKSKPLTIRWNKAGDNSIEPVGLSISYNPSYYANEMSTAPLSDELASIFKIIDQGDDNSVTLTTEELNRFPANGHVRIKLVRGRKTYVDQQDKTFLFTSTSTAVRLEVFVYEPK